MLLAPISSRLLTNSAATAGFQPSPSSGIRNTSRARDGTVCNTLTVPTVAWPASGRPGRHHRQGNRHDRRRRQRHDRHQEMLARQPQQIAEQTFLLDLDRQAELLVQEDRGDVVLAHPTGQRLRVHVDHVGVADLFPSSRNSDASTAGVNCSWLRVNERRRLERPGGSTQQAAGAENTEAAASAASGRAGRRGDLAGVVRRKEAAVPIR